jgi:hypothetical protein
MIRFGEALDWVYLSSIVLSLDFFAERRGHHYIVYLQELVEKI